MKTDLIGEVKTKEEISEILTKELEQIDYELKMVRLQRLRCELRKMEITIELERDK